MGRPWEIPMSLLIRYCRCFTSPHTITCNTAIIRQLIVGCVLSAGLTSCVQEVKTVRIHPNCPEIPATTFSAVGLDAKAGALQFGKLVTVGEFTVKSDPKIISGISQS